METYDPISSLQHFPVSLSRFGTNPYGEPLYRVVFAPSRRHLVTGVWDNGEIGARWVPRYRAVGNTWILEKWLSAEQYAQCSKQHWDAVLSVLGEWPERGVYDCCHVFEIVPPIDCNFDKLIAWIEAGRTKSFQDTRDAIQDEQEQKLKNTRSNQDAFIKDKLPSFGTAAMIGYKGGRGTKTKNIGVAPPVLPNQHNKFINLGGTEDVSNR